MNTFSDVIYKALVEINYTGPKDNNRLRAAIEDLGNEYPQEKKLFKRNADDRFLHICNKSMRQEGFQCDSIIKEASQYLQEEYLLKADHADSLAENSVAAFAKCWGREKESDDHEETLSAEKEDVLLDVEEANADATSSEETPRFISGVSAGSEETGTPKKRRKWPIIAGVSLAVILALLFIPFQMGDETYDESYDKASDSSYGTKEIEFVPDYSYPDRKICFDVPSNMTIEGPNMTNEILFYTEDEGPFLSGIIDSFYSGKSAWIDTDDERIALWESGDSFSMDETPTDSGFIEIDGRKCSWFETDETDETELGYGYHLIMPFSEDEQDACLLSIWSDSYDDLQELVDEVSDTITIICE